MLAFGRRFLTNEKTALLRYLSSRTNLPNGAGEAEERLSSKQSFVKTPIEPGEWDPDRTNPLYRPKFRSTAKIISADDFANRPTVGLSEEFESLEDGMVILSWLDQNDQKLVYQHYLDLMVSAEASSGGRTSHEYVMRVIAQKFQITADRVAAIVQLQHNEQQMILENPEIELETELADEMDRLFKADIDEAYATFNLKKPDRFVEDPVGTLDMTETKKWVIADDVFDVDQMAEDAIVRDERNARLIIDGHVYIEDVDKESIPVPLDKDCKSLLRQRGTLDKRMAEENEKVIFSQREKKQAIEPKWPTTNGEGETRERYKFIAQTVNTRQLKKSRAKHRSYINNNVANTLVEHNGELRAGNMADIELMPWKAIRNDHEHTYAGAKQGWLDRMNRNATKSWGKAPPRAPRLQQPVPLPPADAPTAAVGSSDEVPTEENMSDHAAEAITATNIDDTKDLVADSQGSDVPTPQLSSQVSPDQEPASQLSTTTTASEADVTAAGDMVATNITDTNDTVVDFQGMDQPVDDVAATIIDETKYGGDEAVADIAATIIDDTKYGGADSQGSDVPTPELSSQVSPDQDPTSQLSTTTTAREYDVTDAVDAVATNVADTNDSVVDFHRMDKHVEDVGATIIDDTKYGDADPHGLDVTTPELSNQVASDPAKTTDSETDFADAGDKVATNVTASNDSNFDFQGLKQPFDDVDATIIDDTKYGGDGIHASDVTATQLSSEVSPDQDLAKTTDSETDVTDAGDTVATNVNDTNDSSVDYQGSVDQALSLSTDMSTTDATDDRVVDLHGTTTTATGDIVKDSDIKEEETKNTLLVDEKLDNSGKDPI